MALRPYQQETLAALRQARDNGENRVLAVLSTGGGKTVILSHLPETLGMDKDEAMLVLVHRDELVWQSCDKLRKYNPSLVVDIEKAQYKCDPNAHIIVASVQTIGRNKRKEDGTWEFCERIQKFDPARFKYIVVDECLTGDSLVTTSGGLMRIDDPAIVNHKALSYNEVSKQWEYKSILRWIPQGTRQTLRVRTDSGELCCTANHKVLTQRGWLQAGTLRTGDLILRPASADADSVYRGSGITESQGGSRWGTTLKRKNGAPSIGHQFFSSLKTFHAAHADAARSGQCQIGFAKHSRRFQSCKGHSRHHTSQDIAAWTGKPSAKNSPSPSFHPATTAGFNYTYQRSPSLKGLHRLFATSTEGRTAQYAAGLFGTTHTPSTPPQMQRYRTALAVVEASSTLANTLHTAVPTSEDGKSIHTCPATNGERNTRSDNQLDSSTCLLTSKAWYTERSSGTLQSSFPISVARTRDSRLRTGLHSKNGANIRQNGSLVSVRESTSYLTPDTASTPAGWQPGATLRLHQHIGSHVPEEAPKPLPANGWTEYQTRGLRGGTWTMGPPTLRMECLGYNCTLRAILSRKTTFCANGSKRRAFRPPLFRTTKNPTPTRTTSFRSVRKVRAHGYHGCASTLITAWSTSSARVVSIELAAVEPVYDIEVEDNHNFVANGLLAHNCHHAAKGASYQGVLAYFGVFKPDQRYNDPSKFLLGTTATPNRADNIGLEFLFDKIICPRDIRELIQEGWLANPKAYRIDTHINLEGVDTKYGDFVTKQLEKAVNTPERNALIVREYLNHGEGLKAMAFTVDVQHTMDLVEAFREEGVLAYGITGSTPTPDRQKIYRMYNEGTVMVLISCAVLTEGADFPIATVGLMARPTKSGLLYTQMVGRLLRPFPAPEELAAMRARGEEPAYTKEHAIILDFTDSSSRHSLNTLPTLFGLRPDYNAKGGAVLDQVREMEALVEQKKLAIDLSDVHNLAELKGIAEKVDLFAKPVIPQEVQKYSKLAWYKAGLHAYQIVLDSQIFRIQETGLGKWKVSKSIKGVRTDLGECVNKGEAFKLADGQIPAEERFKVNAAAQWRNKDVTDAQINLLWKIDRKIKPLFNNIDDREEAKRKFAETVRSRYNSGDVSMLLQQYLPAASKNWKQKSR